MLQREYQLAHLVEAHIEAELAAYSEVEVFSTPYRNGREKGFVFSHHDGQDAEGRVRSIYVFAYESRPTGTFMCVTSLDGMAYSEPERVAGTSFLPHASKAFKIAEHVLDTLLGQHWRGR